MKPIFNSLEFDGINSMDHGVFITGESVYNAPERDVESVEIPGRNGDVLIDNGRWRNIDVTYHAGTYGKDQAQFASKIRNFRNLLASRHGYHRLADTYNPEEYRMGTFKSSVEVDAEGRKRAGEFDVIFNCKPQRYLTSGEAAISVQNGETLFNPTPYDASPLLAVEGYGTIGFNGYEIEIENATFGKADLVAGTSTSGTSQKTFSNALYNTGDTITLDSAVLSASFDTTKFIEGITANESNPIFSTTKLRYTHKAVLETSASAITFTAGTSKIVTNKTTVTIAYTTGSISDAVILNTTVKYTPNVSTGKDRITYTVSATYDKSALSGTYQGKFGTLWANSTISLLGDPTYIDCDLGDAYTIKDDTYISLNSYIDLGSDLPVLASGQNEITLDDTITELKITPRWWIL